MSVSGRIGLEIKLLRERLQLSAKDLAERVGLSPSQMSRLESGQRRVDALMLSRIARALEVHPSYFFQDFEGGGAALPEGLQVEQEPRPEPAAPAVPAPAASPPDEAEVTPLGRLIRNERRRRHLTADELARKVGKGRAFLQDLEEGRTDLVTGEVLSRIGRALKLEPDVLLDAQRGEIRELRRALERLERAHSDQTLGALRLDDPASPRRGLPIVEAEDGGLPQRFDGRRPEGRVVDYVYFPGLRVGDGFAVQWRGDEMRASTPPSFETGELLVFASDRPARHRDFVLAALRDGRPCFRQLFMDPKGLRLQPLNLDYPPHILERDDVLELFVLVARMAVV